MNGVVKYQDLLLAVLLEVSTISTRGSKNFVLYKDFSLDSLRIRGFFASFSFSFSSGSLPKLRCKTSLQPSPSTRMRHGHSTNKMQFYQETTSKTEKALQMTNLCCNHRILPVPYYFLYFVLLEQFPAAYVYHPYVNIDL